MLNVLDAAPVSARTFAYPIRCGEQSWTQTTVVAEYADGGMFVGDEIAGFVRVNFCPFTGRKARTPVPGLEAADV